MSLILLPRKEPMQDYKRDRLEIKMEQREKPVMRWIGASEARQPYATIDSYVDNVLAELQSPEIEIDFCELEYMNSATLPSIIRLVSELSKKKIKVTVVYSRTLKWQRASFKAIESLSKAFPTVTVESR